MKVLLVDIEMVNTQTLTSQLNEIDHIIQQYFSVTENGLPTFIIFLSCQFHRRLLYKCFMENITKFPISWICDEHFISA